MLTTRAIVEAAGITAAIAIVLVAAICIWANETFKRDGVPADDQEEN